MFKCNDEEDSNGKWWNDKVKGNEMEMFWDPLPSFGGHLPYESSLRKIEVHEQGQQTCEVQGICNNEELNMVVYD